MIDERTGVHEWKSLNQLQKHYLKFFSGEEINAVANDVKGEFVPREGATAGQTNKEFLNKLSGRLESLLSKK